MVNTSSLNYSALLKIFQYSWQVSRSFTSWLHTMLSYAMFSPLYISRWMCYFSSFNTCELSCYRTSSNHMSSPLISYHISSLLYFIFFLLPHSYRSSPLPYRSAATLKPFGRVEESIYLSTFIFYSAPLPTKLQHWLLHLCTNISSKSSSFHFSVRVDISMYTWHQIQQLFVSYPNCPLHFC